MIHPPVPGVVPGIEDSGSVRSGLMMSNSILMSTFFSPREEDGKHTVADLMMKYKLKECLSNRDAVIHDMQVDQMYDIMHEAKLKDATGQGHDPFNLHGTFFSAYGKGKF